MHRNSATFTSKVAEFLVVILRLFCVSHKVMIKLRIVELNYMHKAVCV